MIESKRKQPLQILLAKESGETKIFFLLRIFAAIIEHDKPLSTT